MSGRDFTIPLTGADDSLAVCREAVKQAAAEMGFSGDELIGIISAVFEACVNAVTHGAKDGKGKASLHLHTDEDRLKAVVADYGSGFTCPIDVPIPPATQHRGRGVPMMKTFMDEVRFERDDGCKVTLVKYLRAGRRG